MSERFADVQASLHDAIAITASDGIGIDTGATDVCYSLFVPLVPLWVAFAQVAFDALLFRPEVFRALTAELGA